MSAPTHTPGPWKSTDNGIFANELNAHGNFYICRLPFVNEETSEKERANLALISAAPDLLDALEALMQRAVKDAERYAPDGNEPIWAFISDASDAIAKGKGRAT